MIPNGFDLDRFAPSEPARLEVRAELRSRTQCSLDVWRATT
jgi:hypothetical protein